MCGINGYIDKKVSQDLEPIITKMNNMVIHRGPDDQGFLINKNISMGMQRLSIIDIENGYQPMENKDKSISIVFNGEIYNYKKLRAELVKEGVIFKTQSDTEVILKLYENYGIKSFSMLDGMYAFSIIDLKKKRVLISRDFFGEKPLFYLDNNNSIIWASELKSILSVLTKKPQISKKSLNLFFKLTYIPAPFSIFEGIKKLEPNHYLSINLKTYKIEKNQVKHNFKNYNFESKKQIKSLVRDSIFSSVKSRTVSDVPITSFLSGGVDSSIITYCLAKNSSSKIDTFSIGFQKKSFDESNKAKIVSKIVGSNHHSIICEEKNMLRDINDVILNFDEPFADSSALPSYLLAKNTSKYFKVALTGDGGDEIFGGYNKYLTTKMVSNYVKIVPKIFHNAIKKFHHRFFPLKSDERGFNFKTKKFLDAVNYNGETFFNIISLGYSKGLMQEIFNDRFLDNSGWDYFYKIMPQKPKLLNDFKKIDKILSLDGDLLTKVDRTSMLSSIECRSPFLNKELWNMSLQINERYLIKGLNKKYILKESFKEFFPKNFLDLQKKGFGVPVGDWLRTFLKEELLYFSSKNIIEKQQIFNFLNLNKLINLHIERKNDYSFQLWTFFCFQKWYLNFYEGN